MSADSGFAFPSGDTRGVQPDYGLTKREWFAGMALQGILARQYGEIPTDIIEIARRSFQAADAMISAGGKS